MPSRSRLRRRPAGSRRRATALERAEGGDGDVYAARRAAAFAEAVAKIARG